MHHNLHEDAIALDFSESSQDLEYEWGALEDCFILLTYFHLFSYVYNILQCHIYFTHHSQRVIRDMLLIKVKNPVFQLPAVLTETRLKAFMRMNDATETTNT